MRMVLKKFACSYVLYARDPSRRPVLSQSSMLPQEDFSLLRGPTTDRNVLANVHLIFHGPI